ncbi:MAG: SWIM zinc finger family protein [Candidatus Caenarcaniphilales bacterium]|nr:SWIM zinc finger family protein [Candidatus Caenarcaniphilales bacterium]
MHPKITIQDVQMLVEGKIFARGEEYYSRGVVKKLKLYGQQLRADVQGSDYRPYHVVVNFSNDSIESTSCTCPYDDDCKHLVAVLIAYIKSPDKIEKKIPLKELLAGLPENKLKELVIKLVEADPANILKIENFVNKLAIKAVRPDTNTKQKSKFSRKYLDSILENCDELVSKASNSEYLFEYDSEGLETEEELEDLDQELVKAILDNDLGEEDLEGIKKSINSWKNELSDYGFDDAFDMSLVALEEGWGGLNKTVEELSDAHREFNLIRLEILWDKEEYDDYLTLSLANHSYSLHALALVKMNCPDLALKFALEKFTETSEAFKLLEVLDKEALNKEAFAIAEHGLKLKGIKEKILRWLFRYYQKLDNLEKLIECAELILSETGEWKDYKTLKNLKPFPLNNALVRAMSQGNGDRKGIVEIFITEKLFRELYDFTYKLYWSPDLLQKAYAVLVETMPKPIFDKCIAKANEIMDAKRSDEYSEAAKWLSIAKKAQQPEWETYLDNLLLVHKAKRNLIPKLKELL